MLRRHFYLSFQNSNFDAKSLFLTWKPFANRFCSNRPMLCIHFYIYCCRCKYINQYSIYSQYVERRFRFKITSPFFGGVQFSWCCVIELRMNCIKSTTAAVCSMFQRDILLMCFRRIRILAKMDLKTFWKHLSMCLNSLIFSWTRILILDPS